MVPFIAFNGTEYALDELPGHSEVGWRNEILKFIRNWEQESQFTIQTSGSTGKQRSISTSKVAMETSAKRTAAMLGLRPGMTCLLCLNPAFIAGRMMIVRALAIRMNLVAIEPRSNPLKGIDSGRQLDFAAMVPLQLQTIIDEGWGEKLNQMHCLLIGGAPSPAALEAKIQELSVPVYESFGMTETLSHIALRRMNGPERSPNFKPLMGVKLDVDTEDCLVIEADFLREKVNTRDVVKLNEDGSFCWLGRKDNLINSGGIKILPEKIEQEIEPLLMNLGISNRYFIAGIEDPALGQKAVLVIEGNIHISKQKILEHLKSKLSKYEVPRNVSISSRFEETATGKIDRGETLRKLIL